MDYLIRLLQFKDKTFINKFLKKLFQNLTLSIILITEDVRKYSTINDFENNILSKYDNRNLIIYSVFLNNEIIGILVLNKNNKNTYLIKIMAILPEYQNDELITILLKRSINDIVEIDGCEMLEAVIDDKNKKKDIFKKAGFINIDNQSMINYLPAILKNKSSKLFFDRNECYDSFKKIIHEGIEYNYIFKQKRENLNICINSNKKNISSVQYESQIKYEHKINFKDFQGKKIKIGVIDSGIETEHPGIKSVAGGTHLFFNNKKEVCFDDKIEDNIGHGTACAGIIKSIAPDCQLYSIKIFNDDNLSTNLNILTEAVKWAADNNIDIINLSLGTVNDTNLLIIKDVCDYAAKKNVIIVSAVSNDGQISYPASFNNVIGVYGGINLKNKYSYYYQTEGRIEIVSNGDLQKVCWINKDYKLINGNSFAAPYITGIIALILEKYNEKSLNFIRNVLIDNAEQGKPELLKNINYKFESKKKVNVKIDWIKNACIYPFNKEMHALIRAKDLLNFKIVSIADPVGKRLVGKDAGTVLGIDETGLIIQHDLNKALENADTLILSHVSELSKIIKKDLFSEIILKAINAKKNVFCLDPLSPLTHSNLFKEAKKNNVILFSPSLKFEYNFKRLPFFGNDIKSDKKIMYPFQYLGKHILFYPNHLKKYFSMSGEEVLYDDINDALKKKINVPVIGIFGTSSQQGKFTVQITLRKMLLNSGYKIGQIGTEPHSELFGFDLAFPNGYNPAVKWPVEDQIKYLHYKMLDISKSNELDIIIVGAQSGFIPYDITDYHTIPLPSIAFLFGTKPDAYILTVNSIDTDDHIQKTINALKILGQGEVILLIISDKEKIINTKFGVTKINFSQLTTDQIKKKLEYLENTFKIPATEVISKEGQDRLLNTVIKYFTKDN